MKKHSDIEPEFRKKILEKLPKPASLRFWSLFYLVTGLICLSIASCFLIQSALFKHHAHSTQGEVVNMVYADILYNKILHITSSIGSKGRRINNTRSNYVHYPIVKFTDQNGTEHRLQSPASRSGRYMERIRICVPYDIEYHGILFKNCTNIYIQYLFYFLFITH